MAATALLARVYLYQKNWPKAEEAASAVIGSGSYALMADLYSVFRPSGNEAIWQLAPVISSFQTTEGFAFVPFEGTIPSYVLTPQLLRAFEPGDYRKHAWINSMVVEGHTYFYPAKYKVKFTFLSQENEYNTVLRLGELYFIRSEARTWQNKLNEAADDLNAVRNRAGLSNVSAREKETLLAALEQERQRELFAEWGHRWFDLKRTGRINDVLSVLKENWQPTDALLPLPLVELQTNNQLIQNPGY